MDAGRCRSVSLCLSARCSPSRPSADPRVERGRERAGCCQCEGRNTRWFEGGREGTMGSWDGSPRVSRQMVGMSQSWADIAPRFSNSAFSRWAFSLGGPLRIPLCASDGRAAGGGPKDRLGRRRRRRRKRERRGREGCGAAIQRAENERATISGGGGNHRAGAGGGGQTFLRPRAAALPSVPPSVLRRAASAPRPAFSSSSSGGESVRISALVRSLARSLATPLLPRLPISSHH